MTKFKLIAEIGCNHKGEIDIAKKMIEVASNFCKADVAKFQKRSNLELLSFDQYNSPHPTPENSYGTTYGKHREFLEFDLDQHKYLKKCCEKNNIDYSCSVWDITSANEICSLKINIIKIPSALNLNFELIDKILELHKGEIHVSTGMTTSTQIENIFNHFKKRNLENRLVLYHCTSDYPANFDDINLYEINNIKEKYPNIKANGFSGHHNGISIDIAAATLGATYIERHFTLDRTWKGTDHAASLEPQGLMRLKRDLIALEKSLSSKKNPEQILDSEKLQYEKLKWKKN